MIEEASKQGSESRRCRNREPCAAVARKQLQRVWVRTWCALQRHARSREYSRKSKFAQSHKFACMPYPGLQSCLGLLPHYLAQPSRLHRCFCITTHPLLQGAFPATSFPFPRFVPHLHMLSYITGKVCAHVCVYVYICIEFTYACTYI